MPEGVVEFEDFGTVDGLGVFVREDGPLGDVARCEVFGDGAGVEFVLQGYLDGVASEGDGAEGGEFGGDAGDAGDEEVGFSEVEEGGEG